MFFFFLSFYSLYRSLLPWFSDILFWLLLPVCRNVICRIYVVSRLDRLRITTGIQGVVNLDLKNDANHRTARIIKFTSTKSDVTKSEKKRIISKQPPIDSEEIRNFAAGAQNAGPKEDVDNSAQTAEVAKLSLFQRFKAMYRDYWYVLLPVHVVTSVGWFVGFYYVAKRYAS